MQHKIEPWFVLIITQVNKTTITPDPIQIQVQIKLLPVEVAHNLMIQVQKNQKNHQIVRVITTLNQEALPIVLLLIVHQVVLDQR